MPKPYSRDNPQRSVIVLATTPNNKHAVMVNRTKSDRGWDLVSGKLKRGEDIFEAAHREFIEEADPHNELGFRINPSDPMRGIIAVVYNETQHKVHFVIRGQIHNLPEDGITLPPMNRTKETAGRCLVRFGKRVTARTPHSYYRRDLSNIGTWRMQNLGDITSRPKFIRFNYEKPSRQNLFEPIASTIDIAPLTPQKIMQYGVDLPIFEGKSSNHFDSMKVISFRLLANSPHIQDDFSI